MQIHEITKLSKKRTDEGLLDSFKDAVGLGPKPPDSRTFMQKLKGEAPDMIDLTDPKNAKYAAQQTAYDANLKDKRDKVQKYWTDKGYKVGADAVKWRDEQDNSLSQAIQQVKDSQPTQSQIQGLAQQFDQEFMALMPEPGHVFKLNRKVGTSDVTFTKDEKGIWRNEDNQVIQAKDAGGLEQQLDNGDAKQVPIQTQQSTQKSTPAKKTTSESVIFEARQSLAQKNFYSWIAPKVQSTDANKQPITFTQVLQNKQVKQKLQAIFDRMVAANNSTPPDEKLLIATFKEFMTVAIAGVQLEKNKRSGVADVDSTPKNYGVRTGNPLADKLSQEISPEGMTTLEKNPEEGLKAIQDILNTKKKRGF